MMPGSQLLRRIGSSSGMLITVYVQLTYYSQSRRTRYVIPHNEFVRLMTNNCRLTFWSITTL